MEAPEELAVANVETAIASQSSHFLPNASGFQIVGGQFVLGNVNNHPPVRPVSPPGPAQASPSLSTNSTASSSPPARILAESEVYRNQLLYQKRGFPLYIPEPQRNPAEYRTKGVRIGDVGRVTPEGAFDFLFNIYCSSEHPRNSNRVPDNFAPLEPAYLAEDLFHVDYEAGDYVSTATIQEPDVGEGDFDSSVFPGGEFLFNCHGPDGALLALPHGSHLEKLENLEAMRRYAAKHAESWYKYINAPAPEGRGRRLVNGFLYLITGCEKSQSWGMASFQNVAVEREFKVSFKPQPPADDYRWRRGTPARTKRSIQGVQNSTNHTLFLHGFSISLGEGIWGKLSGGVSVGQIVDSPFHQSESDFIPFGAQGSGSSSFALGLFRCGGHSGGRTKAAQDGDEVQISELSPAPSVFHPSQIINEYLLGKFSQTTVAITHDDDWIIAPNNSREPEF
ncbi:hypothetical protein DFH09DRAFT_583678 [Mycena vulgaris]|nr:hypothetical protein DFH09DRAFT_583678 [Mycena vulgaris]